MEEYNIIECKKHFSKIGLTYMLSTIIVFITQIGFLKLLAYFNYDFAKQNEFLISMLSMYIIAIPISIFIITRLKPQKKIEKNNFSIKQLAGVFFICYAAMYISNIIGNTFISIVTLIKGSEVQNAVSASIEGNSAIINFLIVVLCAPFFEELLFRKILIERTIKYGEKISILLSGLLFGLYHGNLYQFFYAFTLGCIFAYIFCKTGKIIYTMILHFLINFIGSIVAVFVTKISGLNELINLIQNKNSSQNELFEFISNNIGRLSIFLIYFIFVILFLLVGVIIFLLNLKKFSFTSGEIDIPKNDIFKVMFLNTGMIIYILFWLIFIILVTVM